MSFHSTSIDSCKYLYLHSIEEPENGGLCIILNEAKAGGPMDPNAIENDPLLQKILVGANAIEHVRGCKVFELWWPSYVAYAVENESYALGQPKDSIGQGRLFIEYTKSAYLDYLSQVSFASPDYPGAYKHWAVVCLDHIVNVAAVDEPQINERTA